jgi:hypothetical protein
MTDRDILWIEQLSDEFGRVAREIETRRGRSPARALRGRTAALATVAVLLLAGAATAAVTGVFDGQPDGLVGATDKGVVAAGETERGTTWQLVSAQDGGNFCLALRVKDAAAPGPATHKNCGGMTPGTLGAATAPSGGDETLLFGTVPDEATTVTISAGDARPVADAVDDKSGLAGKFFVIELPRAEDPDPRLSVLDERGGTIGEARGVAVLLRASSPLN